MSISGVGSRPLRPRRWGPWLAALGVLLASGALWKSLQPRPRGPVVFISIDTLRADHLPLHGYDKVQTPAIDAFARDAVVFENASTHVPLTLPAHASVFTGLLPFEHGVRNNIGFSLSEKVPTLATALRQAGYATGAAVSAYVLRKETGIAAGFDFYEDDLLRQAPRFSIAEVQRDGAKTVELALDWLRERVQASRSPEAAASQSGLPLFLFVHLYEPHLPYRAPERHAQRYPGQPYDAEVAYSDELTGRMLDELRRLEIYDSSFIALFSDHGEGLGDHGEDDHGVFLYREVLHVPLLVKLPGARGPVARVSEPVGLFDIAPTLYDWIGLEPPARVSGRSLLPALSNGRRAQDRQLYAESLYSRYHFGWKELYALSDERYSYILAPRDELYDNEADPRQRENLLGAAALSDPDLSDRYTRLRGSLLAYVEEQPLAAPAEASVEEIERMQALGYVGSASLSFDPNDELPDPKDRIGHLAIYRRALQLRSQRRFAESAVALQDLLKLNPKMLDSWDQLSAVLARLGQFEGAADALRKSLELNPKRPQRLLDMASLLSRLERDEEAVEHIRLAAAQDPGPGHLRMAVVELGRGRVEEARKEASLAAVAIPAARPFVAGLILVREKRFPEALPLLQEAERLAKDQPGHTLPSLHFHLGDALARAGKDAEAEAHFLRELELSPADLNSVRMLCALYRAQDRIGEIDRILDRFGAENPSPQVVATIAEAYRVFGLAEQESRWRARAEKE